MWLPVGWNAQGFDPPVIPECLIERTFQLCTRNKNAFLRTNARSHNVWIILDRSGDAEWRCRSDRFRGFCESLKSEDPAVDLRSSLHCEIQCDKGVVCPVQ